MENRNIQQEIDDAVANKDFKKVMDLTGLPLEVIVGERTLTRKERRGWYHKNRKKMGLSRWGLLEIKK